MGLDVHVDCGVEELSPDTKALAHKLDRHMATVHVRPGSYAGLHRLREVAMQLEGIPSEDETNPLWLKTSYPHLLHHSDCEGWYLPYEFDVPIFDQQHSIGSSQKLLAELERLKPHVEAINNPMVQNPFDAMYLAAKASVETYQPIKFS